MLKRWLARIAVATAVVVAIDLSLGAMLLPSIQTDVRTYHPYYHHGLLPNRSARTNWTYTNSYTLTTNSLGLRDATVRDIPLTSTRHRLLVVGDSFTEGVGVPFDKTFVGIVQNAVSRDDVEVFNAGVIPYSAMTDYLKVKYLSEVVGFRFDDLVVFYDLSDPYNDYLLEYYEHFVPALNEAPLAAASRTGLSFMRRHSVLTYNFSLISNYVRFREFDKEFTWWTLDEGVFDRWARRGLQVSMKYMQQLVELCRKRHVRMAIAVYPWPNQVERHDLNSLMVSTWSGFAAKNGIGLINYFPDFINDTPAAKVIEQDFRPVDKHWTEKGHAVIAARLLEYIHDLRQHDRGTAPVPVVARPPG